MKSTLFLSVMLLLFSSLSAQVNFSELGMEQGELSVLGGLKEGDQAPEIRAVLSDSSTFVLSEALKTNKVVLIFYRGYWCPVCSRYLSAFEEDLEKLTEKGVQVIAVTPEKYEFVEQTVEKSKLSIPVISDTSQDIMKDYKVFYTVTDDYQGKITSYLKADIAETNGQDDAALPVPATYIIGQDQVIEFVQYDPNYKNRASVDDILAHLDK